MGIVLLIVMWVILGMGEGLVFLVCYVFIVREVSREKRSTAVAAVIAVFYAGAVFVFVVMLGLVSEFGWLSVFYSFGVIVLLWVLFWFVFLDYRESRGVDDEIEDAETRRFIVELSVMVMKLLVLFVIWMELICCKEVCVICVV